MLLVLIYQKIIVNFQIANRSVLLRPYATSPWPEIKIDSLDGIASKMTALIERRTPRDFLDLYTICAQGLAEPWQCWNLRQEREKNVVLLRLKIISPVRHCYCISVGLKNQDRWQPSKWSRSGRMHNW